MNDEQLTPDQIKRKMAFEASLNEEHQMTFTKKELLIIFNLMTRMDFKYGDFMNIKPIVDKIEPIVAVETNVPTNHVEVGSQVITGAKKLN